MCMSARRMNGKVDLNDRGKVDFLSANHHSYNAFFVERDSQALTLV